ncbi:uncharacterized protein M6B38_304825 [Iris pallida]|uniref:Uncharacterized protein n=1 Tax=Iris pallida TaxID=29817 RepID=A0AAX6F5Z0_IRIPA|nr:uncharacterized protein M6B38_150955 [Iris pallida]KAJ6841715.1 uncharacterized protein M6B38_304825 [Iris pallida]
MSWPLAKIIDMDLLLRRSVICPCLMVLLLVVRRPVVIVVVGPLLVTLEVASSRILPLGSRRLALLHVLSSYQDPLISLGATCDHRGANLFS